VHLAVSTKHPAAQEFFDQGLGQLHGFWYFEAERSFRQAAALDPDLAMAYWGMAMANVNNEKRARQLIDEAVKRKSGADARETLWIDALAEFYKNDPTAEKKSDDNDDNESNDAPAERPKDAAKNRPMKPSEAQRRRKYIERLESIIYQYPDEIEAKAHLAVFLWVSREKGLPITSPAAVDALIGDVFAVEPMHPAHHYRIHLWDNAEHPERALRSAALCGPAAPAIAHMWHMPGHTYSKLRRFPDAAWQQEAASRVDHAYMIRNRVLPDEIHNYAHNQEWLIRTLGLTGEVHRGIELAKNMIALPRHPRFNVPSKSGTSSTYGRTRLFDLLVRYELWDELLALEGTMYLEPVDDKTDEARQLRALGAARFATGDAERGKQQIAALEALLVEAKADQTKAGDEASEKARKAVKADKPSKGDEARIARAKSDAVKRKNEPIRAAEQALAELHGWLAASTGDHAEALQQFEKAKMSREFLSRAQLSAGNREKAEELARRATERAENEVYPLANLVDVLHRLDKPDEAANALGRLRNISATLDMELPVVRRIASVAAENNLPADWRRTAAPAADLGPRPPLDRLGPVKWNPSPAPTFRLATTDGKPVSLDDYRGRPVVLIFYLGFGCLHCVEQLRAFGPTTSQWNEAGISLLAISTDSNDELAKSLASFEKDGTFPFPLVSDGDLRTFKLYGAYDDFEHRPLHATLLLDGQGRVLWQDISAEPFKDVPFLLKESKRLLELWGG
jgi:peroxiredoxin